MKILGSIIYNRPIKNLMGFVEVVPSIEKVSAPNNPILIIGLNQAKNATNNFSILDKQISKNIFWAYSKTENREEFENDIFLFQKIIIENNINNIKYYYINLLKIKYNKFKKLYNILINNNYKKYIYIYNNIIYIYYNNIIIGISLSITDYIKINRKKILDKLSLSSTNVIFNNDNFIDLKLRNIVRDKEYIFPYLMYLNDN